MTMERPDDANIASSYSAMLDSVAVIERLLGAGETAVNVEIKRNVDHLNVMLSFDWWAAHDLDPINAALEQVAKKEAK